MKKITLLAVAALAISFASCRKDYTCVCTDTSSTPNTVDNITAKSTKKAATNWCNAAQTEANTFGPGTTCAIK